MAELSDEARAAGLRACDACAVVFAALRAIRAAPPERLDAACDDLHRAVDKLRCEAAALTAEARR